MKFTFMDTLTKFHYLQSNVTLTCSRFRLHCDYKDIFKFKTTFSIRKFSNLTNITESYSDSAFCFSRSSDELRSTHYFPMFYMWLSLSSCHEVVFLFYSENKNFSIKLIWTGLQKIRNVIWTAKILQANPFYRAIPFTFVLTNQVHI
jgi:hypothetical protein